MDVSAASAINAEMLSSQVGVKVARKALDNAKQQGEAAVALIQAAAKSGEASQQAVQNGRLDVTA